MAEPAAQPVAATTASERTPLLRDDEVAPAAQGNETGEGEDTAQLNKQVRNWRRQRWISFVAAAVLIIGFVLILVLSGGEWRGYIRYLWI
jgi:hypothetical protein